MAISCISVEFPYDGKSGWAVMTSLDNYAWRSDISKIEVVDEKRFVEYTKDGFATNFTVTVKEEGKCWAFDLENSNMTGHWKGKFSCLNGKTTVEFTEEIIPKKLIMKPIVGMYLKKQQVAYISDLKKALATEGKNGKR